MELQMKAFTLDEFDTPPALRDDIPEPQAASDEVVVRVQASSANPVDSAIAGGALRAMGGYDFPVTLGRDYAGVIEEVGDGVEGFAPGDEVFGFVPGMSATVHDGSWAERIAVPTERLVRKPDGVAPESAGAAGVAGATALAAVDALELGEGDAVLVIGATGGVGSFAVQLAARAGATVVAPGRTDDAEYLRNLGVAEIIDRDADLVSAVRASHPDGVDGLIDVVSYDAETFNAHAEALREGGRAASPVRAAGDGPGRFNVGGSPDPPILGRLGEQLASGSVRVPIQHTYSLAEAGQALADLGEKHTQGKLAIEL
jgi:NADPH2:quinone reductase